MTTTSSRPGSTTSSAPNDGLRQAVVAVSAVVAVVGAAFGSGAFGGTSVNQAGGGVLSAESTLVAPDGPAFSIWSVIYLGLVALAVWQALPAQRTDARQRSVGLLVAASMLLNTAWLLTVQANQIALSVAVIVALLAVLAVTFARLRRRPPSSRLEAVVVDGTMHAYLGWVSIATAANVSAALVDAGVEPYGAAAQAWAVAVLVVAAAVGVFLAVGGRGRLAGGAALAWGLAWAAVGRTSGPDASTLVAWTAAVASATVVVATVTARVRARR